MDHQILSFTLDAIFMLKLLALKSLGMVIIGLRYFEIPINSQDFVINAKTLLGKNVFFPCLYNMSSQISLFLNGA
jgi:hypothetical protein